MSAVCTVDGCEKVATRRLRTLCGMHESRMIRYGHFDEPPKKVVRPKIVCIVDGCERMALCRSLCKPHYTRILREKPELSRRWVARAPKHHPPPPPEIKQWLSERSCPEPNSGCWLWTGSVAAGGYGRTTYNKTEIRAHRLAYEVAHGPIPDGLFVCHKCDTPSCINPDHLFLGTALDNVHDMLRKGRGTRLRGEAVVTAKLTQKDVNEIRRLYSTGDFYQRELAVKYGVEQTCISGIVRNIAWRSTK